MVRPRHHASLQEALGLLAIGDGYLLRSDRVAVALFEVTPPDLRLLDGDSLAQLLERITEILRTCSDRSSLATFAVPLSIAPLIQRLRTTQQCAPDFQSYAILGALSDWLTHAWSSLHHLRAVRWIIAVPSLAPEHPPSGPWGALVPSAIAEQTLRLDGDPIEEALTRARRLCNQFAGLGLEPPPQLLRADEIRALLRMALDPIAAEHQQYRSFVAPRPLHVVAGSPHHAGPADEESS